MIYKAGVQALMEASGKARPTPCEIRGHCRTDVFALPKVELQADAPLEPIVVVERQGARAAIVSDLPGYFREVSPFRHYEICCALRSKIDDAVSKHEQRSSPDRFRLFVVVEQEMECETTLAEGTCYIVDQEMVTGGSAGEEVLLAWQVEDGPWPETDEEGPRFVATVLAAVKIVQDETEAIREVVTSSCFCDAEGRAVYSTTMNANMNLSAISPKSETDVAERAARMQSLIETFDRRRRSGDTHVRDLVEALRLERVDTDHYRRAWYLSLFEAMEGVLSKEHKQTFHQRHRKYRNSIGHPRPSTKMEMDEFISLQRDSLAELRRMFLGD